MRRAGLEVGATARLPYGNAAEGTVLAQDPPGHAQDIARPIVNLLVAAPGGDEPDGHVMPEMVGWPVVTAQEALTRVGIKALPPNFEEVPLPQAGTDAAPPRPPAKPGTVIAQTPPAGWRVDQSTVVKLTVAQ